MGIFALVILALVVALILYVIGIYNRLVSLKNRYKNGFAQIEVQLTRRYDLIPNLVETAKAYLKHERETLEAVIQARNQAVAGLNAAAAAPGSGPALQQLAGAEGGLAQALGRLNVVMEAYPELKASQNMMQLSEEISSTENKVAFARQAYNDQVLEFNDEATQFPALIVARLLGFAAAPMLEATRSAQEREAPAVRF